MNRLGRALTLFRPFALSALLVCGCMLAIQPRAAATQVASLNAVKLDGCSRLRVAGPNEQFKLRVTEVGDAAIAHTYHFTYFEVKFDAFGNVISRSPVTPADIFSQTPLSVDVAARDNVGVSTSSFKVKPSPKIDGDAIVLEVQGIASPAGGDAYFGDEYVVISKKPPISDAGRKSFVALEGFIYRIDGGPTLIPVSLKAFDALNVEIPSGTTLGPGSKFSLTVTEGSNATENHSYSIQLQKADGSVAMPSDLFESGYPTSLSVSSGAPTGSTATMFQVLAMPNFSGTTLPLTVIVQCSVGLRTYVGSISITISK